MRRPLFALVCSLALLSCKGERKSAPLEDAATSAQAFESGDPKALLAAVDRLQGQLKDRPKSFEVLSALGNLYYENGRYLEAVGTFRQALTKSAPVEAEARALRDKGVRPSPELPLECRRSGPGYGLEQIADVARKLAAADPRKALRCEESALELAIVARARRGDALYLIGNPDGALAEHQKVLALSPDYPESLFFVGAILLEQSRGEKKKLEEGKKYWRRLLAVAPDHPRAALVKDSLPRADEIFAPKGETASLPEGHPAVAAGAIPPGHPAISGNAPGAPMAHGGPGSNELPEGHRPISGPTEEQVRNVAEAVAGTERTPGLEKGLDGLTAQAEALLDQGKYQEARDAIVRVMPMRPTDARTAADMGAAMRGLGRTEMAERVLSRALELNPRQPRALYEMGKLLAARGDKAGAAEKLRAAQAADPAFAGAHKISDELARLR